MTTLEERVAKLEEGYDNILYVMGVNHQAILSALGNTNRRLDGLERKVDGMGQRLDTLEGKVDEVLAILKGGPHA